MLHNVSHLETDGAFFLIKGRSVSVNVNHKDERCIVSAAAQQDSNLFNASEEEARKVAEDRTVIVARGDKDYGKAAALALGKRGFKVLIQYDSVLEQNDARQVVDQIVSLGDVAMSYHCDLNKDGDFDLLVSSVMALWKRLDCLVFSAGIPKAGAKLDEVTKMHINSMDIRIKHVTNVMMKTPGQGRIVNIATLPYVDGDVGVSALVYSSFEMAKRTLALAAKYKGVISVNCVLSDMDKKSGIDVSTATVLLLDWEFLPGITGELCIAIGDLKGFGDMLL